MVAHAVSGRGLLTATALSVEALGRVVPGLDPRIDIGHAVTALGVSGRGLLTATALSVEALGRVVPGLDPRIDIGHAVTALGVSGHGLLTATSPAVSVRVPLPVGGAARSFAIARSPESLA